MCENTTFSSDCDFTELEKLSRAEEDKLQKLHMAVVKSSVVHGVKETSTQSILESKAAKLKAELSEMRTIQYEGIPVCMLLHIALLKQHLGEQVKGLKESFSYIKLNKMELIKEKERLQKNLEQEHHIMEIITNNQMLEVGHLSETVPSGVKRILKELNEKLLEIKRLKNLRVFQLQKFLCQYFPIPDELAIQETSKRDIFDISGRPMKMKSLAEIVELLINESLTRPFDSWVTVDSSMWQPYIELLLRTRIILRNPQNASLIRLVNYHI